MKYKKQIKRVAHIIVGIIALSCARVIYFYAKPLWLNRTASIQDIKTALKQPGAAQHINDYDEEGLTGLMLAITLDYAAQAQLLLDHGASINLQAKTFDNADHLQGLGPTLDTPLHLAIKQKNPETIKLLIERGANVNAKNNLGDAPLFDAIDIEGKDLRDKVMSMLFKAGAELNAQNNIGMTILHKTVEKSDPELMDTLVRDHIAALDFELKNQAGQTAVVLADSLFHLELAKTLKDAHSSQLANLKFPVGADNAKGFASLIGAIKRGDLKQVTYLFERGVNIKEHDPRDHNNTPLHIACFFAQPKIALYLLEHGVDASAINDNGDTPLLTLINFQDMNECKNVLKALIVRGANVNAQNKQGNTLLHRAVVKNNKELVMLLIAELSFDLNLSLKNKDGKTALDLAKINSLPEIVNLLEAA